MCGPRVLTCDGDLHFVHHASWWVRVEREELQIVGPTAALPFFPMYALIRRSGTSAQPLCRQRGVV